MKKVIIRTDTAGVHYGTLESVENSGGHYAVVLSNARRLWQWAGANCLSELATLGSSDPSNCKFSIPVSKIKLMAIEIIETSEQGQRSFDSIKYWVTDKANIGETYFANMENNKQ
jgi:hypothetical protein